MAGHPAHLQHICYFRGEFMPLEAANVNLSTHALQYGTGVFEGIRAYWNPRQEQLFGLFVLEHFQRMARNCRLLRIALPHSPEELTAITRELLARNAYGGNVYIRPIAFKADYKIGLVLTDVADGFGIYTLPMGDYLDTAKGLHCCVSSWQRPDDNAIPARGKLTGSYINACLAADDARLAGYDDTIMLTIDGHVAEGSSCNLFMVRGGKLITTPVTEAILEGVTRAAILDMARDQGIPVELRRIDRTEVYVADEIFLCGTGVQVAPVTRVDHRAVGDGRRGPITARIQDLYFAAVTGEEPRYRHWLTPVYER